MPGCDDGGDDGDDGAGIEPTLTSIQDEIFTGSCALQSCHSTASLAGDLILEPGRSHEQLVGPMAFQSEAAGEGLARVVPGDPDASFLWIRLQVDTDPRYGPLMPQGSTEGLDADELAAIETWIVKGAADD